MNVRNNIENLSQILPSQAVPPTAAGKSGTASSTEGSGNDTAQVSVAAAQVSQSASASDIRLDKVASIQAALQAGTYRVPASDVAQKVITSMLDAGK